MYHHALAKVQNILVTRRTVLGFDPGTVNIFRKMPGINELNFGSEPRDENQTMLSNF